MNPNSNKRGLVTGLVILVIILMGVIAFLLLRKPATNPSVDGGFNSDGLHQSNQNSQTPATTNSQTVLVTKYEDTPESKVVKEESPAYLVAFEKRSDGYYYLSFDYVRFDSDKPGPVTPINDNPKIRTFRAPANLTVGYNFTNTFEGDDFYDFVVYQSILKKKGNYYWNPTIQSSSYQHNGLYDVYIENGMVKELYEVGDFTEAQGT